MNHSKVFFILILAAIAIKLTLWIFSEQFAPEAKFMPDSERYIVLAQNLYRHGEFIYTDAQTSYQENYRTPGYPLFLGIFTEWFGVSFRWLTLFQLFLSIVLAAVVFHIAKIIRHPAPQLSALIILYDPPIAMLSIQALSEILFLFIFTVFILFLLKYFRDNRQIDLICAALFLAASAFVRPISYYIGILSAIFLILHHRLSLKENLKNILFFSLSFTAVWVSGNYAIIIFLIIFHFQRWDLML